MPRVSKDSLIRSFRKWWVPTLLGNFCLILTLTLISAHSLARGPMFGHEQAIYALNLGIFNEFFDTRLPQLVCSHSAGKFLSVSIISVDSLVDR
jgi:hypothetical protein